MSGLVPMRVGNADTASIAALIKASRTAIFEFFEDPVATVLELE